LGHGIDIVLITAFSLPVFWLAVKTRLPVEQAQALVTQASS
jgi:hypothetical protein